MFHVVSNREMRAHMFVVIDESQSVCINTREKLKLKVAIIEGIAGTIFFVPAPVNLYIASDFPGAKLRSRLYALKAITATDAICAVLETRSCACATIGMARSS